jgi:hypothetical protein
MNIAKVTKERIEKGIYLESSKKEMQTNLKKIKVAIEKLSIAE